jgi:4-amino-4-deoxy-L-arabinose transferase-like glycosyltransferase
VRPTATIVVLPASTHLGVTVALLLLAGIHRVCLAFEFERKQENPPTDDSMTSAAAPTAQTQPEQPAGADRKWLRWSYLFIALFFISRLLYIASGRIEISEDEAYQWLWSKHLALSYFSKPPLIAWLQFIGTSIWGDNEFGIRFLSPVLAAILSIALLRFMAAQGRARAGFWLILILGATPLLTLGSTLLTVDAPSVLFWVLAMISAWWAIQTDSIIKWMLTGVWIGLGLLSKYTAVIQIVSIALFLTVWKPGRRHLRTAGPYLALAISLLAFLPVIIWNFQHDWITVRHLANRGGLDEPWSFEPRFMGEFLASEFGLLNPIFFGAVIWASAVLWRNWRERPLPTFLLWMGAPLFLFYFLYTIRGRVLPNWIAPCVVPLLAMMVVVAEQCWASHRRLIKNWLIAGLIVGYLGGTLAQFTEVTKPLTGRYLPAKLDPLHRVREWKAIALMLGREREKALSEGKPVFMIAQHYGLTSILSFYLPEAKKSVATDPLVYYLRTDLPKNQFYFWPGYEMRKGQNAIFVQEADVPQPAPASLRKDFDEVIDLGMRDAHYHGQIFRRYQIYLCRNLH